MSEIKLSAILNIPDPKQYKLHCAIWNGKNEPLDVFVRDREEWHNWNKWKPKNNVYNRDYILSFINFYHEKDIWLFGGIYKVVDRHENSYEVALTTPAQALIGRMKINLKLQGRNMRPNLETYYDDIIISEILKEPYSGEKFCGYENINISFERLEPIYRNQSSDWKNALEHFKGVYLIADKLTGKRYVGSAYNNVGIWSRWEQYIKTGHGGNVELKKLMPHLDLNYARKNFDFTLLEFRPMRIDDKVIIERETFWKTALLSRGDFGYNRN